MPTTEPKVAQEINSYTQVGNGTLVNVFLTCQGDCSADTAFILGQFEDGSTATTTSTVL